MLMRNVVTMLSGRVKERIRIDCLPAHLRIPLHERASQMGHVDSQHDTLEGIGLILEVRRKNSLINSLVAYQRVHVSREQQMLCL